MNIVLFGGGTQVLYTMDILDFFPEYKIIGIIDSKKEIGEKVYGIKVIGRQENISELIKEYNIEAGIISVGDNWSRWKIFTDIKNKVPVDFKFINAIHPSATISKYAKLGVGITIMAGCIVNAGAEINNFTFFATGARVEHNCKIGKFASVSAGSVMGGYVEIGDYSAITLGVVILDRLKIGRNTIIGSGSLVLKDVGDNILAYGNPAKEIRKREPNEKYLK